MEKKKITRPSREGTDVPPEAAVGDPASVLQINAPSIPAPSVSPESGIEGVPAGTILPAKGLRKLGHAAIPRPRATAGSDADSRPTELIPELDPELDAESGEDETSFSSPEPSAHVADAVAPQAVDVLGSVEAPPPADSATILPAKGLRKIRPLKTRKKLPTSENANANEPEASELAESPTLDEGTDQAPNFATKLFIQSGAPTAKSSVTKATHSESDTELDTEPDTHAESTSTSGTDASTDTNASAHAPTATSLKPAIQQEPAGGSLLLNLSWWIARSAASSYVSFQFALVGVAIVLGILTQGPRTVIVGDSMEPSLRAGSVVVNEPPSKELAQPGVVIVYEADRGLVTHRLRTIENGDQYITQGDANASPDSQAVRFDQIRGVAHYVIPYLGLPRYWYDTGQMVWVSIWAASLALSLGMLTRKAPRFPFRRILAALGLRRS